MPFTIPEEIIPSTLTVPDANNYFDIEEGGLPNGDACLVVHGDVNRNYKAHQAALTLTPNVFLSRSSGPWSLSFWFKCASATDPAATFGGISQTLMGVQSAAGPSSYSDTINYVWNIGAVNIGATPYIALSMGDGGTIHYTPVGVRDGQWHLIVYTFASGGTGAINSYVDTLAASGSGSAKSGTAAWTGMNFSIGAYGAHANSASYNKEWRIAKLAFHDHVLTLAERQALYTAFFTPDAAAGLAALQGCTAFWNATTYTSGALVNSGTGGSVLNLTVNGSPTYTTDHFVLDGVNDSLSVNDHALLRAPAVGSGFTIGIIASYASSAGTDFLMTKRNSSDTTFWELYRQTGPAADFFVVASSASASPGQITVPASTKALIGGGISSAGAHTFMNGVRKTVADTRGALGASNGKMMIATRDVPGATCQAMNFYGAWLTQAAMSTKTLLDIAKYFSVPGV